MPYQQVHHTKLTYHAKWQNTHTVWDFKFGFQRNHRQEYSFFHSHYANQTMPEKNPDLELDFQLHTLNAELFYKKDWVLDHTTVFGVQNQYQTNEINGYSYLMPAYNRWNTGFYAKHSWNATADVTFELGVRYDLAHLNVEGYFDEILYHYLIQKGTENALAQSNAQRSVALTKDFSRGNMALGVSYRLSDKWESTFTVASNFRFPTAMELSSNGIHHGAFRHEKGNPNLDVEKGWAFDLSQHYHIKNFKINASAYLYYFTNYIFLKPSGTFSVLPHGGQIYQYDQSKAMLAGIEIDAVYQWKNWGVQAQAAYLYNQQISDNGVNYPLPFSTPMNGQFAVRYAFSEIGFLKDHQLQIGLKSALKQERIAQGETQTPGYTTAQVQWRSVLNFKSIQPQVRLQINNIFFNTVYYHHNSFYRTLDIPEFGRNIQLYNNTFLNIKEMKKLIYLSLVTISLFGFTSCEDDDNDTEKPGVKIITPTNHQEIEPGTVMAITASFTDNAGLSSYKIEIHSADDGHEHKAKQVENFEYSFEGSVNNKDLNYELNHSVAVPADVADGHYHVGITVLDVNGNQNQQYVEVFIGHEHEH